VDDKIGKDEMTSVSSRSLVYTTKSDRRTENIDVAYKYDELVSNRTINFELRRNSSDTLWL